MVMHMPYMSPIGVLAVPGLIATAPSSYSLRSDAKAAEAHGLRDSECLGKFHSFRDPFSSYENLVLVPAKQAFGVTVLGRDP